MKVSELIRILKKCDQNAEVVLDDMEPLGDVEKVNTDAGPAVILWSQSSCDDD